MQTEVTEDYVILKAQSQVMLQLRRRRRLRLAECFRSLTTHTVCSSLVLWT